MRLHHDQLLTRSFGTIIGVGFIVFGAFGLIAELDPGAETSGSRAFWYGLTLIIGGVWSHPVLDRKGPQQHLVPSAAPLGRRLELTRDELNCPIDAAIGAIGSACYDVSYPCRPRVLASRCRLW